MPINKVIAVIGGAGYIGSHMVVQLQEAGFNPIIIDDLRQGKDNLQANIPLYIGNCGDRSFLESVFAKVAIDAVMHFAGSIEISESVLNPHLYYQNNVTAFLTVLEVMRKNNVKKIIYSSSAAVYGEPQYTPIDENHHLLPIHPYGRSKKIAEEMLTDYAHAFDFNYVILRYFNACGADALHRAGEHHIEESHLIPRILQAARSGLPMVVFGDDYPTFDGACIRDYVHVTDICSAHLLALHSLAQKCKAIYNVGTEKGHSIFQVIEAAKEVTRLPIHIVKQARRAGDPVTLVANAAKLKKELGWQPQYPELKTMIEHAWGYVTRAPRDKIPKPSQSSPSLSHRRLAN